jgi:hypothetical protein
MMESSTPYRPSKVHQRNPLSCHHAGHSNHRDPSLDSPTALSNPSLSSSLARVDHKPCQHRMETTALRKILYQVDSVSCQHLQQNHLTLTDSNHGPIWLSKMVTIIWTHCHHLWESRNKDKHGHDSETQKKILLEQVWL